MSGRVGDVSAENNAEIESTRHSPEGYGVPPVSQATEAHDGNAAAPVGCGHHRRRAGRHRNDAYVRRSGPHHEGAGIDEAPARRWLARSAFERRSDGLPPGALIMLRYRGACALQAASAAIPAHNPEMRKIDVCGIMINCAGQRKTRRE
jgi:hypothetical protein